jgi:hypothetical protein
MEIFDVLKYGTIGLCAILMFFAYQLLLKEQKAATPHNDIIKLIRTFMLFAVAAMAIGLCSQLPVFRSTASHEPSTAPWPSGLAPTFFNDQWQITDGHDVKTPQFTFEPRYAYSGTLRGHAEGNVVVLEGIMHANDINNRTHELGKAQFTFRGPVNNTEVAGYFTYSRADVNGFGAAFLKIDSVGVGTIYMIVRVTSPIGKEGDVAMVVLPIRRVKD